MGTHFRPHAALYVWRSSSTIMLDLESFQQNFTKRLPTLEFLIYTDGLKVTAILELLEYWRLVIDISYSCFKIVRIYSEIQSDEMLKLSQHTTSRGHPNAFHPFIPLSKINLYKFCFAHRIILPWNSQELNK